MKIRICKATIFLVILCNISGCIKTTLVKKLTEEEFFKSISKNEISVIAPASGVSKTAFAKLHGLLKHHVHFNHNIMEGDSLFHSKEDELRAKDFIEAIMGSKTVLWVLRGGYGSTKLIKYLYKMKKPPNEKIIIGYSDITALHIFLSQKWGWKAIHGAMITELLDDSKNINNFRKIYDVLNKMESVIELRVLNKAKFKHDLCGKIIGGNISIIQNSLGTKWQIKTRNKILFLEGFGDKSYKIDRILNHFSDVGLFADVKAVVFGQFYQPEDEYIDYVLGKFAEKVKFPVFKTDSIGHGPDNFPIVINSQAKINRLNNCSFNLITKFDD